MYRDDHDALLVRADNLQRELDEKKARLEAQDSALEDNALELAQREKELRALRKRLAKLEPKGKPNASAVIIVAAGLVLAAGGAAAFIAMASSDEPAKAVEAAPPVAVAPTPPQPPAPPALPLRPDPQAVKRVFGNALPALRQCIEDHIECTGVLSIRGHINPDGELVQRPKPRVKARAQGDDGLLCPTAADVRSLRACALASVVPLAFPRSLDGGELNQTVVVRESTSLAD